MVKNFINYIDEFDNKVRITKDEDGDFKIDVNFGDGYKEDFLVTKKDFKKMKYLDAILGVKE